jgi:hypothetical protein
MCLLFTAYGIVKLKRFGLYCQNFRIRMVSSWVVVSPSSDKIAPEPLNSVHPKTSDDAGWYFQSINEQFSARSRKSRDCAETYLTYVAQEIPMIAAEIAEKGHLWMEMIRRHGNVH